MAAATDQQLIRTMDRLEKHLAAVADRPASRAAAPSNVFGGFAPRDSWRSDEWPADKLKALAANYNTPASMELFARRKGGRARVSGMGPALVRLATRSGQNDAIAIAKAQGMPEDYDDERFEKEFGFASVAKARAHGVKQLNGEVRKVALAEGSGQTGGYLIPPQYMNELLLIAAEDAFIEPRARVIPMNTRTAQWPMLDITTNQGAGTSPYFGGITGSWQPEASTINETEPQFRQSEWTAWDLVLYTVSSNQLLADNGIGLDAFLTQLLAAAVTWYKEYAFINGKGAGSSMPLGIMNAPATFVQNRAASGRVLLQDAATMMSHLHIRSWDDACWIMHQSVIPQLIQMVGGGSIGTPSTTNIPGNQLAWMSPFGAQDRGPAAMKLPNAFLNGLPIFFTEKVQQLGTKGDVILADLSLYVIGLRLDIQIDVSPHYLFRNNQLAWRVIARVDGKPWLNNLITDAAGWQLSPFIVLN
jgi:HK97 family phage major capsid protein